MIGRLEQDCPKCGLAEAAGSYCSRCYTVTGPDAWRKGKRGKKDEDNDDEGSSSD